ncbi:hypothetical protein KRR40_08320 [Niabella defluvii]|nr:hypothetical protein KRR40_08320 [Niabella sp. I65]
MSSLINWSWIVTAYNISHFSNPDWKYLESLDYNKELLNKIYIEKGMDRTNIVEKVYTERAKPFLSKSLYIETISL